MAVVSRTIDLAATGGYVLAGYTTASSARAIRLDEISDSSSEFELPREIRVSEKDFKLFLVTLATDQEPNEKLRLAAEDYREKHG